MKRKIFSVFFSFCLLFAPPLLAKPKISHLYAQGLLEFSNDQYEQALPFFEEGYKTAPGDKDNLYLLGLTHLRLHRFDKAEHFFKELLKLDPEYSRAYADYGLSLYHQDQFAEALPWFEKARNDKTPYPLFYAGLSHMQLNHPDEAKEFFHQVLESYPDTKAAQASKEWIARLDEGQKPEKKKITNRFSLRAAASFFYDSNVTLDPDSEDLANIANQKDAGGSGALNFRYLLVNGEKFQLSGEIASYQSAYSNLIFDSNNFNFGRHQGGLQAFVRINDNLQFRFPGFYTFTTVGKAKYLQSGSGGPVFDFSWKENWLTSIGTTFQKDQFFGEPANTAQDRDAYRGSGRLEQFYFLPQNREVYFKLGYEYEKNLATGADWDYQAHHATASAQTPLFWDTRFLLVTDTIFYRKFASTDSIFNDRRKDLIPTVIASLSRDLFDHVTASLSYTFVMSRSNINHFDYKRHVGGLTIAAHF